MAERNIVGEVNLLVKPIDPNSGFDRGVKRIIDNAEKAAQLKIGADTSGANTAIDQLQERAGALSNKFVEAAANVAGITAAMYALRGAANAVIGKFAGLFDQLAQARAGFSSILKSEEAGNTLLEEIQEFARVSPFVTQELVNYSQQLLGVGVASEKIIPLLEDVGNIISSVGGDTQNLGRVLFTLTQIQSIGRLAGQDAMQLQSALIPITKYLSEFLGKTTEEVKKLQEQGKISAETVFQAISAQGDKVEGAMANATRNIAGARAILGDTITLMLQQQPVLQRVFEDIFQGILRFADFLAEPQVTNAINDFFAQAEKLYDALVPLGSALAEIGSEGGISGLRAVTVLLEALATALSAIPEPAMKAFAVFLTTIATFKAPLLLIKYVQSFQTLTRNVLGSGIALRGFSGDVNRATAATNAGTVANDRYTASLRARAGAMAQAAKSKLGGLGGIGALGLGMAGQFVADGQGGERDALGTFATYTAMGAALGGAPGAIAGGVVGMITAISTASKQAKEAAEAAAEEAAAAYVDGFLKELALGFGVDTTQGQKVTSFLEEADRNTLLITEYTESLAILKKEYDELNSLAMNPDGVMSDAQIERFQKLADIIPNVEESIAQFGRDQETLFQDNEFAGYLDQVAAKLALLNDAVPGLRAMLAGGGRLGAGANDLLGGQTTADSVAEFQLLETSIARVGLTLDQLISLTPQAAADLIALYTGLPDAIKAAEREAIAFNKALGDAQAVAAGLFDGQQARIAGEIGAINNLNNGLAAQIQLMSDVNNETARLTAEREALAIAEQAMAWAQAQGLTADRARIVGEKAYADAIELRGSAQMAVEANAEFQTEERIKQLLELAGLADEIDNREIILKIAAEGVNETLAQIETLTQYIIDLRTGRIGTPGMNRDEIDFAQEQIAILERRIEEITSGGTDQTIADKAKEEWNKANAERLAREAEEAAEEARRMAEEWANKLESAGDSLSSSIESAAESIVQAAQQWTDSVKERTQYEQSVSAARATRNVERQIADIDEVTKGIQDLKSRGVSQAVLDALGIDSLSDTRQVRKLVNSSDADLAALTQAVAKRDEAAMALANSQEDKRTRDNITAGILAAAETLGIDMTKQQAGSISAQFDITNAVDAEQVALQILGMLTSGRIG